MNGKEFSAIQSAQGYTHSYWASEYGYNDFYNGDTVVVYTDHNELPPLMRLDAIKYGKPIV